VAGIRGCQVFRHLGFAPLSGLPPCCCWAPAWRDWVSGGGGTRNEHCRSTRRRWASRSTCRYVLSLL